MKKGLLIIGALAIAIAAVPLFAAFEAHVINVTAKIENALSVSPDPLQFGTVFPNEYITKPLKIALSGSFLEQNRLDDVQYNITQKPKPKDPKDHEYCIEEKDDLFDCILDEMKAGATWQEAIMYCLKEGPGYDTSKCYPSLCSFLSKLPDRNPDNDGPAIGVPHPPAVNTWGMLSKLANDIEDTWTIDLKVPCFIGQCVQGEEGYLPPAWESMVFGCDLWIKVTGFSQRPPQCSDGIDNDKDQLIDYPEPGCDSPTDDDESNGPG